MLKNGQTNFKNLAIWTPEDFKGCLAISQHHAKSLIAPKSNQNQCLHSFHILHNLLTQAMRAKIVVNKFKVRFS